MSLGIDRGEQAVMFLNPIIEPPVGQYVRIGAQEQRGQNMASRVDVSLEEREFKATPVRYKVRTYASGST